MKMVKVRIACAVNASGDYHAQGWNCDGADDPAEGIWDGVDQTPGAETLYWITATVPVPELTPMEVEGSIEEAVPH